MIDWRARVSLAVLALVPARAAAGDVPVTVIWTGETNALLGPCGREYRPGGGLARRATVVARERARGPVVLVDAGGWAAGGLRDERTEGAEVDAVRTEAAARAMAAMQYDAVAMSGEELAWGPEAVRRWQAEHGLRLVSANLFDAKTGERFAPAFRIVEPAGRKLALVGLVPAEITLVPQEVARRYRITDPIEAAREAASESRIAGAEALVLLSPLGEEMSERLAYLVEGVDLVVNSGRRLTEARSFRAGGTLVGQSDFQGRAAGLARLDFGAPWRKAHALRHVEIGPDLPDDPEIAAVLGEAKAEVEGGARRVLTIELFKMSLCPYVGRVEETLSEITGALHGRVEVRVTHVVRTDEQGSLTAPRGPAELDEARRQAAIQRHFPERYWDYSAWRSRNLDTEEADWKDVSHRLGIDVALVERAIASGEADRVLRRHAYRAGQLGVSSSPTLRLGGRGYEGGIGRREILLAVRSRLPGGPSDEDARAHLWEGLPECFSDADCRKPGFVGECRHAGTERAECVRRRAVKVRALVVEDWNAVYSPVDRILGSLRVFLPGLEARQVDFGSPEGRGLVERYGIERLPAYVIDRAALGERDIEVISEALVPRDDKLLLAPHLAGSHHDITRPGTPGPIDLFLSPHSKAAAGALSEALDFMDRRGRRLVRLRAAVRREADGKLGSQGGLAELEEMLREIAVGELYPGLLHQYLRARLGKAGSGYWQDALLDLGIDPEEVRGFAEGDRALGLLDAEAQELVELGAGGPVVLVVPRRTGREVVPVISRAQFRHVLEAPDDLREDPGGDSRAKRAAGLLVRALEDAVVQKKPAARERIMRGLKALSDGDFAPHDGAGPSSAGGTGQSGTAGPEP